MLLKGCYMIQFSITFINSGQCEIKESTVFHKNKSNSLFTERRGYICSCHLQFCHQNIYSQTKSLWMQYTSLPVMGHLSSDLSLLVVTHSEQSSKCFSLNDTWMSLIANAKIHLVLSDPWWLPPYFRARNGEGGEGGSEGRLWRN